MFYLYVTNFVVSSLDDLDSSLTVNPEAIDFGNSLYTEGMTATETVTVSAIKIHNVTASVEAPYSVSLDGTTFAASIALPDEDPISNTTTIYVQFAPTAAGSYPGVVTLTNGTTTATVTLSAEVVDCNIPATLPFIEDFEDEISACWTNTDNDGDGYTWMQMTGYEDYAHSGSGLYTSASWVSGTVLTPDNWLITPALAIPEEGAHLDFWVGPQDPSFPAEHYQVKVSTTGTNVSDFTTTLIDETLTESTWVERVANLDFAGQNVFTELDNIRWSSGETNVHNIVAHHAGAYVVTANTAHCQAFARLVIPACAFNLYIPNAITPSNDDGTNDFFCLPEGALSQIELFEICIFDRWGRMVFRSESPHFRWDGREKGKLRVNNTYTYYIKLSVFGGGDYLYKGVVTVL